MYALCRWTGETPRYPSAGLYRTGRRLSARRVDVAYDTAHGHYEPCSFFSSAQKQLHGCNIGLRATLVGPRIHPQVHDRLGFGCARRQV